MDDRGQVTNVVRRQTLAVAATARLAGGVILLFALLFMPAGTLEWWEAWLYLATLFIPVTAAFLYLAARDPAVLERRRPPG